MKSKYLDIHYIVTSTIAFAHHAHFPTERPGHIPLTKSLLNLHWITTPKDIYIIVYTNLLNIP